MNDETRIFSDVEAVASIKEWAEKDNLPSDHWHQKVTFAPDRFEEGKDYLRVRNPIGRSIIHLGDTIVKDKNGNLWRLEDFN